MRAVLVGGTVGGTGVGVAVAGSVVGVDCGRRVGASVGSTTGIGSSSTGVDDGRTMTGVGWRGRGVLVGAGVGNTTSTA